VILADSSSAYGAPQNDRFGAQVVLAGELVIRLGTQIAYVWAGAI